MDKYVKWFWMILSVIFIGSVEDIFNGDNY